MRRSSSIQRKLGACLLVTAMVGLAACGKLKGGSSQDGAATATGTVAPPGNTPAAAIKAEQPFAGTYTKYAVTTFKNGQRVISTNNTGQSTITIAQGLVTWAQTYTTNGQVSHVTQTYTFQPEDVRPVTGGFDVALVFQKMDADTKTYSPDRNSPKIQARKQTAGWQIGLLTTDNNGVSGGVEFK